MIDLLEKLAELDPDFCEIKRDHLGVRSITLKFPLTKEWSAEDIRNDWIGFNCQLEVSLLHQLTDYGLEVRISKSGRIDISYTIDGELLWNSSHKGDYCDPTLRSSLLDACIAWLKHKPKAETEGGDDN